MINSERGNVVIFYAACQDDKYFWYFINQCISESAVSCGIGVDQDSDQRIRSAIRMNIRKSQPSLIFIKGLRALRISTGVKRLELLACDPAISIVRLPNQVFDLCTRHADLQLSKFAARSGYPDDFPIN